MRDWKTHQWVGAAMMALGFIHVSLGLYILVVAK
jgi:hypothetical protein